MLSPHITCAEFLGGCGNSSADDFRPMPTMGTDRPLLLNAAVHSVGRQTWESSWSEARAASVRRTMRSNYPPCHWRRQDCSSARQVGLNTQARPGRYLFERSRSMRIISKRPAIRFALAVLAVSASGSVSAQQQTPQDSNIVVTGVPAPDAAVMTPGPEVKGVISARNGDRLKVTTANGSSVIVAINDATRIRAGGGLFSSRSKLAADSLLNGLPVTVKTLQPGDGSGGDLLASQISFRKGDLKTATMIRNGTAQGFEEQTAATEALRGRLGDIDKYNVKATTNVHFDTGKADLSAQDQAELCTTAASAEGMENALILVVGYTDSTGPEDFNQELSEKRAGRVINFLQQKCGWKPYRMLTPTGMATADPLASNDTEEGKALNRRVAVNILVSKSVDGL
jgi:OOP family OmpA-OmpF porin